MRPGYELKWDSGKKNKEETDVRNKEGGRIYSIWATT